MLPCQQNCPRYEDGCHKACPDWKSYQAGQEVQRRKKKAYLSYYNDLCSTVARQFNALTVRRPIIN